MVNNDSEQRFLVLLEGYLFLDFGLSKCSKKKENGPNYDTPKNLIERRHCILQRINIIISYYCASIE